MLITARKGVYQKGKEKKKEGQDAHMGMMTNEVSKANDLQFFGVSEGCVNRLHGNGGKSVNSNQPGVTRQLL